MLYLSQYFEQHREEYYAKLQNVREKGEINEYLKFFFQAIKVQADDAINRSIQLISLREKYYQAAQTSRSKVESIIPIIFSQPYVTSSDIEKYFLEQGRPIQRSSIRNLLQAALKLEWITHIDSSHKRGGKKIYAAPEILDIISDENPIV